MTHLLDTVVVSEWTKPVPDPNVVAWLASQEESDLFLSVATLAELRRGIEAMPVGRRRDRLDVWLSHDLTERFAARTLVIDRRIAETWGVLAAGVTRASRTVGPIDVFLAATATVHGLTLVTRNVRDFSTFDVPLVNPWDGSR